MRRLTDVALRAALAKAQTRRVELPDGTVPGLTIRIGPGAATWSLQLRVTGAGGVSARGHRKTGRRLRISVGEYPVVTIESARAQANVYLDQAKRGISPTVALEKAATAGGLTIDALAKTFLEGYVRMKGLRAYLKYEGAIRVHIVPRIGKVVADLLEREQVRELVKNVMVRVPRRKGGKDRPRGGKEAARTVLGVLRKMINWGMREELLTRSTNPATGMEDNLPKKRKKERVLSTDEARIVWEAAGTLGHPFGPVYQLILLTGSRPGEWSACHRDWIDLKQALNVTPADNYKSGHVHVVPLVPLAVKILDDAMTRHRGQSGDYIFSGTDGEKPLSGWTKAHERMMRAVCAVTGERAMKRWTPQDLRRTVATRIAEQLGIGGEQLIQRVLGHSDGSVTAIYNRYGYVKEMRSVLEQWVRELTSGQETMGHPSSSRTEKTDASNSSVTHGQRRLYGDSSANR